MSEEREINVTDMDKIAELNSYRRLRKAESVLIETAVNEEVEDCLKNGKSFSNIVQCNALLKTVNGKEKLIEDLNGKIQSLLITDTDLSYELTESYKIMSAIRRLEFKLKIFMETKSDEETTRTESSNRPGVKLPKFEIKRFSGDPLEWETFKETFETAIEHNRNLTKIEKFTYLRGYLEGTALQAIDGFPLTNDNYSNAWNLLKERYGNPQLITSCHINNLMELEAVSGSNVKDLRGLFDKIKINLRALKTTGIHEDQIGPLLIPIVLKKLPNVIRLQISRRLGKENWNIEEFMDCINTEIIARENYEYLKKDQEPLNHGHRYSGSALNVISKTRKCVL